MTVPAEFDDRGKLFRRRGRSIAHSPAVMIRQAVSRLPAVFLGAPDEVRELFHFRKGHAALTRGELIWIDNSVPESIVSYLRRTPEETVFFAANLGTQSHRVKFDLPEKNAGEEITLQSGETILRQL